MAALKLLETTTVEAYLKGEKTSPVKHEYVHGRVFALAGISDVHNRISINLVVGLDAASTKKGCQLFAADLKLSISGERYYYPDLMVTCEPETDAYIKKIRVLSSKFSHVQQQTPTAMKRLMRT